jgi:RNA polymerase sigma factor (sigma-70 family)
MTPESDAELITRVLRSDDRGAFSALVSRHQAQVRALLRRMTAGDLALADDLAQETFVKAYLKLSSFKSQALFSTWLYRIATNAFLMERRKSSSRETPGITTDALKPNMPTPRAGDASALAVDLERAMESLSDPERAAIALCYAGGLSHAETAQILELPVGTVKTHILRGKDKLRPRLAAWKKGAPR